MRIEIRRSAWQPAPAIAPRPLFAIGDVHGRQDLMATLFDEIAGIIAADGLSQAMVICLGDYIDRGPSGLGVLNIAFKGVTGPGIETIQLPGNHEQLMLHFLFGGHYVDSALYAWLANGGDSVARELGFETWQVLRDPDHFRDALRKAIGNEILKRLIEMPNHIRCGPYLFVHAGIHPEIGLTMLDRDWRRLPGPDFPEELDPLWIRGPFLTYGGKFEDDIIVVHGHTPQDEPELLKNRINIDTRAYQSGQLTALQLMGGEMRLIHTVDYR